MKYEKTIDTIMDCWKEVVELLMEMYSDNRYEVATLLGDKFIDMVWKVYDDFDFADE